MYRSYMAGTCGLRWPVRRRGSSVCVCAWRVYRSPPRCPPPAPRPHTSRPHASRLLRLYHAFTPRASPCAHTGLARACGMQMMHL
eukprot:4849335-Prymnesium_polylepis.1